ncbi:MAG: hypothetical protein EXQ57_05040 [Bryobacterales bacterium]|nr:hypothetical protein [Bryobacterales bacterium]
MKYWLFFSAKIVTAVALFAGIWLTMEALLPDPVMFGGVKLRRFGQDLTWTTAIFGYFLAGAGTLYVIVLDQRYRCRTCLRRLRMPVNSGAWDQMLRIGTPQVEYICPFGHGTLNVKLVHFAGREGDDWREHDDNIWRELESLSGNGRK